MERHLLQAKARSLAEDERNLTPSTTNLVSQEIVLPNGPSQFRKQLNEDLLSRHCLLSPSEYLPLPLVPRDAPKGESEWGVMQGFWLGHFEEICCFW